MSTNIQSRLAAGIAQNQKKTLSKSPVTLHAQTMKVQYLKILRDAFDAQQLSHFHSYHHLAQIKSKLVTLPLPPTPHDPASTISPTQPSKRSPPGSKLSHEVFPQESPEETAISACQGVRRGLGGKQMNKQCQQIENTINSLTEQEVFRIYSDQKFFSELLDNKAEYPQEIQQLLWRIIYLVGEAMLQARNRLEGRGEVKEDEMTFKTIGKLAVKMVDLEVSKSQEYSEGALAQSKSTLLECFQGVLCDSDKIKQLGLFIRQLSEQMAREELKVIPSEQPQKPTTNQQSAQTQESSPTTAMPSQSASFETPTFNYSPMQIEVSQVSQFPPKRVILKKQSSANAEPNFKNYSKAIQPKRGRKRGSMGRSSRDRQDYSHNQGRLGYSHNQGQVEYSRDQGNNSNQLVQGIPQNRSHQNNRNHIASESYSKQWPTYTVDLWSEVQETPQALKYGTKRGQPSLRASSNYFRPPQTNATLQPYSLFGSSHASYYPNASQLAENKSKAGYQIQGKVAPAAKTRPPTMVSGQSSNRYNNSTNIKQADGIRSPGADYRQTPPGKGNGYSSRLFQRSNPGSTFEIDLNEDQTQINLSNQIVSSPASIQPVVVPVITPPPNNLGIQSEENEEFKKKMREKWTPQQQSLLVSTFIETGQEQSCARTLEINFGAHPKWSTSGVRLRLDWIVRKVYEKFKSLKTKNESINRFKENWEFISRKASEKVRVRLYRDIITIYTAMLNMSEEKRDTISRKIVEINRVCQLESKPAQP